MKKVFFALALMIFAVLVLAGCQCKHEYAAKVVKQVTCGADGVREFTCTKCGDSYQMAIPATGDHSYTSAITKDPTCTKEGTKTFTCKNCGNSYTESVPATGEHKYSESVTKKATCTEDGVKTFKCKTCGDTYTEKIKAAHTWKDATCTEPKTCKVCGKKQGSALGHTTDNGKCSRCGETFVYGWTQSDMYDLYNYASEANKQYDIYMSSVGIKSSLYPSRGVTACAEMRKLLEKANAIVSRNNDLYFQDASTGEAADSLKQTMKKTMDDLTKAESECKKYLKSSGALDNFYVDTAVLTVTVDCLTLMKEVKVYYGNFKNSGTAQGDNGGNDKFSDSTINFDNAETVRQAAVNTNDCNIGYDSSENAMKISVNGSTVFFTLQFDGSLNCADYTSVTVVYKTDIEYCVGDLFYATSVSNNMTSNHCFFSVEDTNGGWDELVFEIEEFDDPGTWTGMLKTLRFGLNDIDSGSFYIKSITLNK